MRLTVMRGHGKGESVMLRRAVSLIGSGSGCKIRLKHHDVSRVHLALVNTGEELFVRDLLSKNGTFLNELRAEHEALEDDDVLKVKPWQFRIEVLGPTGTELGDYTGLGLDPSPAVVALEDTRTGEIVKLPRRVNLIGRRPGCDLVVEDRSLSRAHALVFTYLSRVVVYDLASHNGVKLNGEPVKFATLHDGDTLTLGTVDLKPKIVQPLAKVQPDDNGDGVQAPQPEGSISDRIDLGSAELERH
ncbi:MAG: FHA domain-containing protein [Phycisphaerae bacterium]